jgi:hypothetical protein
VKKTKPLTAVGISVIRPVNNKTKTKIASTRAPRIRLKT